MIDNFFRGVIQKKIIDRCFKNSFFKNFNPNLISFCGCIFGLLSAILVYYQLAYFAILLLLASGLFDIMDGTIARLFQKKTELGCVIDILFDRIVECSIIFSLFLTNIEKRAFVSMFLMSSMLLCITSFLVVSIFSKNNTEKGFCYSPGICERAEAFIFFILMILFPSLFQLLSYVFAFLMLITAFVRTVEFVRQSKILKVNNINA